MASRNPYAPSKASLATGAGSATIDTEVRVWRDGRHVVMLHDASLPARCVKCNQPADPPTKARTMYWVHPACYLLFFAGVLILLIVYLIIRKKAEVNPGLCESHKRRRLIGLTAGWLGFLLGLGCMTVGLSSGSTGVAAFGILLLLAAIVTSMIWGRLISVNRITNDEVRLGGCASAYLDELPDYPR
jgi:peptidoglycan/LPS O-acetylase OafA/YrhL